MTRKFLSLLIALICLMTLFTFPAGAEAISVSDMTPDELYVMGLKYYDTDRSVTFTLWQEAAQTGHPYAMFGIGTMYLTGEAGVQDLDQAVEWLEKADKAGHPEAKANLGGILLQRGERERARALWLEDAKNGNGTSMYNLGVIAYRENDLEAAAGWWLKSAETGCTDGIAMIWKMYYNGYGVSQSNEKALEWLEKGAEAGSAECAYQLGLWYEDGYLVAEDERKAFEMYEIAAQAGHAAAMCNLSWCYSAGYGTEASQELALEWTQKAAYAGDEMSMHTLANILLSVEDPEVQETAMYWLEQSAALGYEPAQEQLNALSK